MHGYYRIPLIVRDDIRTLEEWVERFRRGELAAAKFRGFRVPLGIYEQRQENTYMMRVRLPGGAVTPAQLRALARLAREYGVKLHLTTRQDIQLQNVQLDQLAPLYRALYSVGLTCKGGGGNTVRNITACPDAGVCSREAFNVLPYAIALTEYLLPFPSSYNLPRKFKIAFSACSDDCALATVNDLGFIAKVRKGEPGFAVYAAGGLGAYSQVALKLHDFVPASEIGYVAEAVKRLFDQYGDRKRKHQARLRFVVRALGAEKFRELYQQELQRVKEEGPIELELPSWSEERREGVTVPLEEPRDGDYQAWKRLQVRAQKQAGFYLVRLPVPLGDIEPEMLESLADLGEVLGEGSLRITQTQDLLLRWVREEELPYLYNRLRELGLAEAGTRNLDYLVCCKGAATCKLGLCHSGGLCRAIAAELDRAGLPLSQWPEVNLRASGCPNACGQHPLASIGLHGAARRVNGRAMPFYSVLLGGKVQEGRTALARPWGHVPAKNVPALLRDFLQAYQERRETYHSFEQFVEAEGQDLMQQLIEQYKRAPAYEENPDYYRDWDTSEEFSLAGRGAGECGAGVFDMIESDLDEAKSAHALCQQTRETELLYQAVVALARSLLVLRGLDPQSEEEVLAHFEQQFVAPGWVASRYRMLLQAAREYRESGAERALWEQATLVPALAERIKALYESMDANLQFQIEPEEKPALAEPEPTPIALLLDLRGVQCPLNYVRAKMALEEMEGGDLLELLLDDGEPIMNVPPSLEDDGQDVLEISKENGYYRVKVRKQV